MIEAFLSGFRILAEAMFVLRGWSLTTALVIFGFVFAALIGVILSAVGGQAGILTGLVIVLFVVASAVLARRSAKQRIVNNMARRDSIERNA